MKDLRIKDLENTVKRLQKQLEDRSDFERSLMFTISCLETRLNISQQTPFKNNTTIPSPVNPFNPKQPYC